MPSGPAEPAPRDPFFIVGSARSGTTLLRMLLNAHPDIAVPPESRFIVELWPGRDEIDRIAFLEALAAHRQFRNWSLPIDMVRKELGKSASLPYAEAVATPYRVYAEARGKSRWGDKTPRYVEHLPLLARLFPTARFVHMIRDGRNVAMSYADVPFGPKTVARAADLWARRVRAGIEAGRPLKERYIEMRYEDLVDDLEGEARDLCEFLGLKFDASMLDYTEKSRSEVLPRAARYNPNVTERPIANVRSWESTMPPSHVEVFEAVAWAELSELGYDRRHDHPSIRARVLAAFGKAGLPVARLPKPRPQS